MILHFISCMTWCTAPSQQRSKCQECPMQCCLAAQHLRWRWLWLWFRVCNAAPSACEVLPSDRKRYCGHTRFCYLISFTSSKCIAIVYGQVREQGCQGAEAWRHCIPPMDHQICETKVSETTGSHRQLPILPSSVSNADVARGKSVCMVNWTDPAQISQLA